MPYIEGDTPTNINDIRNAFHLQITGCLRQWINEENISFALTTYEGNKLIIIGPGFNGETSISERDFERCMSLQIEEDNIWITTRHNIWKLENGLDKGLILDKKWDRVYLPRSSYITGEVDIHEIARCKDGFLYGVITLYNCIAKFDPNKKGSFQPFWKPPFINALEPEDRCHLNGMCLDNGEIAYASMVAQSNVNLGWKEKKNNGGLIMDVRTEEILISNLSMPHTPRIKDGYLWFLEAGAGYLCRFDLSTKKLERILWRPGFLRGLTFYKNFAFLCSSAPRDKVFKDLPLQQEIENRNEKGRCAVDVVNLESMKVVHSLEISGGIKEIYDIGIIENCRQPLLHGLSGPACQKIVVLGEDETDFGPTHSRKKDQ